VISQNFRIPPAIIALILQAAAVLSVLFFAWLFSIKLSLAVFAGSCGLMAVGLSYAVKLPRWWLVIQASFVPALMVALALELDPVIFLAAFLVTALVYWNVLGTRVPLYLSSKAVWRALEKLLPLPNPENRVRFIDIGSGLGGVIMHLATNRPDITFTGIESAPLPFLWSWLRIRSNRYRHCKVHWGSFWDCDLSGFDVVFAYLSPAPMEKLWQKAQTEMKPGAVFISSTFSVPGQTPAQTVQVDDLHRSTLMIWQM
jgi:Putative methyltransferase